MMIHDDSWIMTGMILEYNSMFIQVDTTPCSWVGSVTSDVYRNYMCGLARGCHTGLDLGGFLFLAGKRNLLSPQLTTTLPSRGLED